jgi:hypothetical protein
MFLICEAKVNMKLIYNSGSLVLPVLGISETDPQLRVQNADLL